MKLESGTIKYIADLAMIELLPAEEEMYSKTLEQILSYTEVLNELDMEKLNALPEADFGINRFREDIVAPSMQREALLSNSKGVEEGMFCIPNVFM